MKRILSTIGEWLDYLGGISNSVPTPVGRFAETVGLALWWAVLAGTIALFCGQTSKFIYIDF